MKRRRRAARHWPALASATRRAEDDSEDTAPHTVARAVTGATTSRDPDLASV